MKDQRLYQVIQAAHTTEKTVRLSEKHQQVVFRVAKDATKQEVAQAVKKLFSVEVEAVRIVNTKGKKKHFKQRLGRRSDGKKAYVSLAEGHDINLANFE